MLRAPISQAGSTRRGMVAAQVVLSLSVLMAMLAVVADGGLLLVERRHAQATADAAALAAASDLYVNWTRTWHGLERQPPVPWASPRPTATPTTARLRQSRSTSPPRSIPADPMPARLCLGYAEAIVTWYQQRFFSGIFGSGAIPVSARAVARGVVPAPVLLSRRPRGVSRVVVRGRMNQGLGDSGVWSARHSNKRTLFPGWDSFGSVLVKCR